MTFLTAAELAKLSPDDRANTLATFAKDVVNTFQNIPKDTHSVFAKIIAARAGGGDAIVVEGMDADTAKHLTLAGFTLEPTGGVDGETRVRWTL